MRQRFPQQVLLKAEPQELVTEERKGVSFRQASIKPTNTTLGKQLTASFSSLSSSLVFFDWQLASVGSLFYHSGGWAIGRLSDLLKMP